MLKSQLKAAIGRLMPGVVLVKGRPADKPRVSLTFDDGPHPEHSPRLLDIFAREGIKVSFFVVGADVERHPELVRRMLAEGHEVANHSYDHYKVRKMDDAAYLADLLRCQQVLDEVTGQQMPLVVRPPYGIMRARTTLALARRGYRHILWSQDSDDSAFDGDGSFAAHVAAKPIVDGDILLLHEDYAHTVEEMPQIIAGLRERGFDMVRSCDL